MASFPDDQEKQHQLRQLLETTLKTHPELLQNTMTDTISINTVQAKNGAIPSDTEIRDLEQHFLKRVMTESSGLEWLAPVQQHDENSEAIGLDAVYTASMTTSFEDQKSKGQYNENKHRLSAPEKLNRHEKRVLTGAPGSGKHIG